MSLGHDLRKSQFIDGVGWCLQSSSKDTYLLLFHDGSMMAVETQSKSLEFADAEGHVTRGLIDASLPNTVKTKLVHFREFLCKFSAQKQ